MVAQHHVKLESTWLSMVAAMMLPVYGRPGIERILRGLEG